MAFIIAGTIQVDGDISLVFLLAPKRNVNQCEPAELYLVNHSLDKLRI